MRQKKTWTEEQLRTAASLSPSFNALLRALGLKPGTRCYLQEQISKLGIDISHFKTGQEKRLCSDELLRVLVPSARTATEILT